MPRAISAVASPSLVEPGDPAAGPIPGPGAAGPPRPQSLRASEPPRAARAAAPVAAIAARPATDPLWLTGLDACVEDARAAAALRRDGPPDPVAFAPLRARLERAAGELPPDYRRTAAEPLLKALDRLGPRGFERLLAEDPLRQGEAALLLDLVQGVLQHGEGYQARATAAFQEVVSDVYAGFVAAAARRGVKPPELGATPPLVRWGSGEAGPYTWPPTATATLGVGVALVSLPAANATGGLLAWPALAHEAAGHDLLAADLGLRDDLSKAVRDGLTAERMAPAVADYWADRIDEAAADVMGVLNMGPAAAVGLIGYFRAINETVRGVPALRSEGLPEDPHPADLARAYLVAETVRLLSFDGAGRWADRLVAEADRDLGRITLGEVTVTAGVAKDSAAAVARAIVKTRLASLDGRALGEIQGWSDRDEAIAGELRRTLGAAGGSRSAAVPGKYVEGAYAAHAVAAAVYEAASGASSPAQVQARMVELLARMNAGNPAWAA
jgi:hypothetical protein